MNLIDNEEKKNKEQNTKLLKIIIIAIVVLVLILVAVLSYSMYLQSKEFKFIVDDKYSSVPSNLFIFEDEDVYVSIKDMADVLGYEYNKGEYNKFNEDSNQCFIQDKVTAEKVGYEVAGFQANSEKVYKVVREFDEYEYYTLKKKVKSINGKLYTTPEGIELGFNTKFIYNKQKNQIAVYTLDNIVSKYANSLGNTVITSENMSFSNKKALKYGWILVQNSSGLYGVNEISTGDSLLGTKYSSLRFMESSQDFIVTTPEKKQGIMSAKKRYKY
ncbi:MAG: hypothetical protein J6D03_02015 [Clostridia bacterium]|nr:hypothetical protein [Clostridia bacterium]